MAKVSDVVNENSAGFYQRIDDDDFKKLKSIFNWSGRGRRPNPPSYLACTNRLLLQFYYMKDDTKSWDSVANFASNHTGLQASRLRALILKTHQDALLATNADQFLLLEVQFVGDRLQQQNISRNELLQLGNLTSNSKRTNPIDVTNGIIIDLSCFAKSEGLDVSWLCQALTYLAGVTIDVNAFKKQLKKIQDVARKKCKSKNRNNDYEHFLNTCFDGLANIPSSPRTPAPPCRKKIKLDNSQSQNTAASPLAKMLPICDETESSPLLSASKGNQIRKLKGDVDILAKDLKDEQQQTSTLRQLVAEQNEDFTIQMSLKLDDLNVKTNTINTLQTESDKIKAKLHSTAIHLEEKKNELAKIRHAPFYKRMRRWEKRLNEKEQLAVKNFPNLKMKTKLKRCQTLLSNTRQVQKKLKEENNRLKLKIKHIHEDILTANTVETTEQVLKMKDDNTNKYTNDVIKCVIELLGEAEVSGKNCGTVIDIVCRNLFHIKLNAKDIPSERSSIRYADKGHVLAKYQLTESILEATNVDLHSDGTTRDHQKIVGHQISTDTGALLSCGFTPVCREDTKTLVDIAYNLLHELADVHADEEVDSTFRSMLQHMTGLMSDRASVMKSFNNSFTEQRNHILGQDDDDVEFLHCNAHFLLGLSAASDKVLKVWEKHQDKKIGRDNMEKFKRFSSASETAGSRFIRTACDILGPRGDEKNGCKDSWEAFCSMQGIASTITSFKGNRFNNLFQAAASLHYHRGDLINFLKNFMPALNMKQESVLYDAECDSVDAIIVALGLVYEKVTGPYWALIGRDVKYLDFFKYVTEMRDSLAKWQDDARLLMEEECPPLFNIKVKSQVFPALHTINITKQDIVVDILQKLCAAYKDVVDRQLSDFLPEGRYHNITDPVRIEKMAHSKLTNLIGEACFGDLDFSIFKRRNASIHHHSTINMLKRNATSAWFEAKSEAEQNDLLRACSTKSEDMRRKHQEEQRQVLANRKQMLVQSKLDKDRKAAELSEKKRKLAEAVQENGGPCMKPADVLKLLKSKDSNMAKLNAIKDQIRYHKTVLGGSGTLLKLQGPLDTLTKNLRSYLGCNDQDLEMQTGVDEIDLNDTVSDEDGCNSVIEKADFGNFNFKAQGQYVAVFYDNDFYIGQVLSLESAQSSRVSFMEKCRVKANAFRWAAKCDVEIVESEYVFDWDFDMSSSNGRMWSVNTQSRFMTIQKRYQLYRELYC